MTARFVGELCVCSFLFGVQEMAQAWEEYNRMERSVEQLRTVLRTHMNYSDTPQVSLSVQLLHRLRQVASTRYVLDTSMFLIIITYV